ncbi:hypothetical protein ACFX1X_022562 [Malus domestica]
MIALFWNCRGLGNPQIVQALHRLLHKQDPTIVFFTKSRYGGIALLWNDNIDLRIISSSHHHINAEIGGIWDPAHWCLIRFYGHPISAKRHRSWNLLRSLTFASSFSWVCGGDFNVRPEEKEGGNLRPIRQILDFREAIEDCNLSNLGFSDEVFTWITSSHGGIKELLDRILANFQWKTLFSFSTVTNLKPSNSYHNPIHLEIRNGPLSLSNLKDRDCNSRFFHKTASCKKLKNRIWGLNDVYSNWTEEDKGIEKANRLSNLAFRQLGIFTVKNAYHVSLALTRHSQLLPSFSVSPNTLQVLWKWIWAAGVPPKGVGTTWSGTASWNGSTTPLPVLLIGGKVSLMHHSNA